MLAHISRHALGLSTVPHDVYKATKIQKPCVTQTWAPCSLVWVIQRAVGVTDSSSCWPSRPCVCVVLLWHIARPKALRELQPQPEFLFVRSVIRLTLRRKKLVNHPETCNIYVSLFLCSRYQMRASVNVCVCVRMCAPWWETHLTIPTVTVKVFSAFEPEVQVPCCHHPQLITFTLSLSLSFYPFLSFVRVRSWRGTIWADTRFTPTQTNWADIRWTIWKGTHSALPPLQAIWTYLMYLMNHSDV